MNQVDLEQLLALGASNEDSDTQLMQQKAISEALRSNSQPQMRGAGRVSVAPGMLETLASGLSGYMSNKKLLEQGGTMQARSANRQKQMALLLRMLKDDPQQDSGIVGPGMMPPQPGMGTGQGMVMPQRPSNQGMIPPQGMQGY